MRAIPLLLALALALAATAHAQDKPCATDVARLCPDVDSPGGQLQCLKVHRTVLSPACKRHVAHAKITHDARLGDERQVVPPPYP